MKSARRASMPEKTQSMKLHFEPNLDYQQSAIESVCEATDGNAYIHRV